MPHYSVSLNLPLLDKKIEIGSRAEAFGPGGFDEQPSRAQVLHARQVAISSAFPIDPHTVA